MASKPNRRGEKPAINRLTHVTALSTLLDTGNNFEVYDTFLAWICGCRVSVPHVRTLHVV